MKKLLPLKKITMNHTYMRIQCSFCDIINPKVFQPVKKTQVIFRSDDFIIINLWQKLHSLSWHEQEEI